MPSLGEALRWFTSDKKDVSFESLWRAIVDNPSYLILYLAALAVLVGVALISLHLILPRRRWAPDRPWGAGDAFLIGLLVFIAVYIVLPLVLVLPVRGLLDFDGHAFGKERIVNVTMFVVIVVGLILLLAVMTRRYGRVAFRALGFRSGGIVLDLVRGFFLALLTYPLIVFLMHTFILIFTGFGLPVESQETVLYIKAETDPVFLALACFVAIVCAPLIEEPFFRGLLLQGFKRDLGRPVAILVSSALFAVVHGVFVVMPVIFLLGVMLGYVYERTDRLWAPMAFHATFNAVNIGFLLLSRLAQ